MKAKTDLGFYYDETGERLLELFRDAEKKRDNRRRAVQQTIFWFVVILTMSAVLYVAAGRGY